MPVDSVEHSPWRFRFRLTSLLILFVVTTPAFRWLGYYVDEGKSIVWHPFSKQVLDEQLALRQIVLVNFRAEWCLTSVMHDETFRSPRVRRAVQAEQIVPLEADWTDGDARIKQELESHGVSTIPTVIIYRSGCEPIILRDIFTEAELIAAMRAAGRRPYCQ